MQPIADEAKKHEGLTAPHFDGGSIVLPRPLRKPIRFVRRFFRGGFRVTKRGLVSGLVSIAAMAAISFLGFSQKADYWRGQLAATLGFVVERYEIAGNHEISDADVVAMIAAQPGSAIFSFDVSDARRQLHKHPWISQAIVSRIYPNTISVEVEEHDALAVWQTEAGLRLIREDGTVLQDYDHKSRGLPLVVGEGANSEAAKMLALMQGFPNVSVETRALVRVGQRRWNLVLNNNAVVMLPEQGLIEELTRLSNLVENEGLLARDIVQVDMRMADRMVLRMSEAAGEAIKAKRTEQLKRLKEARKGHRT